jgi:hypothetical protein
VIISFSRFQFVVVVQALWAEPEVGGAGAPVTKGQTITEQILSILEVILLEASQQPPEQYSVRIFSLSDEYNKGIGRKHTLNHPNTQKSLGELKTGRKLEDGDVELKLNFNK